MDTDIPANSYSFLLTWLQCARCIEFAHKLHWLCSQGEKLGKRNVGHFFSDMYSKENDSFTVSSPELWIKLFWLLSASLFRRVMGFSDN